MRHAIETAPRDGKVVILVDDAREIWGIAYWSLEAGEWVGRDGKPSIITPTHWHPFPRDNGSSTLSQVGPSARRRRSNYFAAAAAATLIGLLFYATLDAHQPVEQVVARGNQLPSQNSKIALPASGPTEANHANASEEAQQVRQVAVAAAPEAEQSLKRERAQALAQELTEARRIIEEPDAQLRAKAQLLEQEREKAAALTQEVADTRQELTTSAAKLHQGLGEERERRATVASDLATRQHAIETQAAQLRKASEAEQLQQAEATESATLLVQEREKTAALVQEALTTSTAKHRQALDEERERRAATWNELAAARCEIEMQAAQLRKVGEEPGQPEQSEAAESARSLEEEREKMAALAEEVADARPELTTSTAQHQRALAEARREIAMQAAQSREVSEETGQPEQTEAAESARLLEEEREKTAAIAREVADARQGLTTSRAKQHQALGERRARRLAMGSELATQRSSPIPRKPPRLNRGHNARQSWGPLLWLWGLDRGAASRWQRTTHVSVFGLRPSRSSSRRQPAG